MTLSCGLIFFLRIKDRKDRAGSEVRHSTREGQVRETQHRQRGTGERAAGRLTLCLSGLGSAVFAGGSWRTSAPEVCAPASKAGGGKDWAGPGQWAGSAWKPMERAWPHARPPRQPPAQASALQGEKQEVPRLGEKAGKGVAGDRPGEEERGKERQRTCLLKL